MTDRTRRRRFLLVFLFCVLVSIPAVITCGGGSSGLVPREITEINDGSQHGPMGPISDGPGLEDLPLLIGGAAVPDPLPPKDVPPHPYLAESGGVHVDGYNTDVSDWDGPLGIDPEVVSRCLGTPLGICFMRAFHPDGSSFYSISGAGDLTRWEMHPEIFVLRYFSQPYLEELAADTVFEPRKKGESKKEYQARMKEAEKARAKIIDAYYHRYLEERIF